MKTTSVSDLLGALTLRTTESALDRMRGLLGRQPLQPGEAMVIEPCSMVHTVGMRYAIDVVFVDRRGLVLQVSPDVPPMRMRACIGARAAVETKGGEAARRGWVLGSRLAFLARPT